MGGDGADEPVLRELESSLELKSDSSSLGGEHGPVCISPVNLLLPLLVRLILWG